MDKHSECQAVFNEMTYGIYVLTAAHGGVNNGMIASWVTQVSHDPFLVLVAVHPNRYSHSLIEKSGCFALHVLSRGREDLLARFKGPDPEAKFKGLAWAAGKTGCPILADGLGHLECEVIERLRPGNHTLFLGRVVDGKFNRKDVPLSTLDYSGTYVGDK